VTQNKKRGSSLPSKKPAHFPYLRKGPNRNYKEESHYTHLRGKGPSRKTIKSYRCCKRGEKERRAFIFEEFSSLGRVERARKVPVEKKGRKDETLTLCLMGGGKEHFCSLPTTRNIKKGGQPAKEKGENEEIIKRNTPHRAFEGKKGYLQRSRFMICKNNFSDENDAKKET